jgi:hypothetical protein
MSRLVVPAPPLAAVSVRAVTTQTAQQFSRAHKRCDNDGCQDEIGDKQSDRVH